MLIGIEATRANKPVKTGVEWYAWHVIQELKEITTDDQNSWILYSNAMLTSGLERLPTNWYEVRLRWPFPYGWTQIPFSFELARRPLDVLWMPGSTLPRVSPKRTVVTVHDVGFHRLPELYKPRQLHIHERSMKEVARRAARIMTVSEFSAREISELYGIPSERIAITPCGIESAAYHVIEERERIEECLSRYKIPTPYFIAVGRLEAKKNIQTLVRAFSEFKQRRGIGDPHALVLVGTPGFRYEDIRREIDRSSARAAIHELGYVPEHDMPVLLNAATALVHPSWYEGFGIPPIQAMACGCPVISSTAASLPEICGDAAILCSPSQDEDFTQALIRIVDDHDLSARLRASGLVRATRYTWRATAEKTLPVLTQW